MNVLNICFAILFMVVHAGYAQSRATIAPVSPVDHTLLVDKSDSLKSESDPLQKEWDHLTIISDSRINKLIEIQKEESSRKGTIDGYRVQIYQGTKKDYAYQLKSSFLAKYPDYKVYVLFQTPDFRVRIGDFRNRSEAIKLKYLIEKDFPNPFIVEDNINFPELINDKKEGEE